MLWIIFGLLIAGMLVLDLGVFRRRSHVVKLREALIWSGAWISLAFLFGALVHFRMGHEKALEFVAGYLIEESLSVDNLFIFLVIFSYFRVPRQYEHQVLFWGILGAVLMRGIFIVTGVTLIRQFHWLLYLFGLILIVTALKLAFEKDKEIHPETNPILRLFRRLLPVTEDFEGAKFLVHKNGRLFATPLLAVLIVVESTDVIFAIDSVPAVLAITQDPFIVYTSNIFAILGLRSLYFALAGMMSLFHHLHYGLAFILGFVGIKMLLSDLYKIPVPFALGVIAVTLLLSIAASLIWPRQEE